MMLWLLWIMFIYPKARKHKAFESYNDLMSLFALQKTLDLRGESLGPDVDK